MKRIAMLAIGGYTVVITTLLVLFEGFLGKWLIALLALSIGVFAVVLILRFIWPENLFTLRAGTMYRLISQSPRKTEGEQPTWFVVQKLNGREIVRTETYDLSRVRFNKMPIRFKSSLIRDDVFIGIYEDGVLVFHDASKPITKPN